MNRLQKILDVLKEGPASSFSLALITGIPNASVRRDIQTLRQRGWVINDARDNNGLYRLVQA